MDSLTRFSTDRSADMLHGWGGDGSDGGICGSVRMDDSVSNGVTVGNCASTFDGAGNKVGEFRNVMLVWLMFLIRTSSCRPLTANGSDCDMY